MPGSSTAGETISAPATDPFGNTSEFSQDIRVDTPPAVVITNPPATGLVGAALDFTSSVADANPGDTFTYLWSVTLNGQPYPLPQGNEEVPSPVPQDEPTFSFAPAEVGTYQVFLSVTNGEKVGGTTTTSTGAIQVMALGPVVTITDSQGKTPPTSVTTGTTINLASQVTEPDSATPTTYAWGVTNDGNAYPTGTPTDAAPFSFTPSALGEYLVSLSVTDTSPATGVTTASIDVVSATPVYTISGPSSGTEGVPLAFTSSNINFATYAWSVTDYGSPYALPSGTVTNEPAFNFTPAVTGKLSRHTGRHR